MLRRCGSETLVREFRKRSRRTIPTRNLERLSHGNAYELCADARRKSESITFQKIPTAHRLRVLRRGAITAHMTRRCETEHIACHFPSRKRSHTQPYGDEGGLRTTDLSIMSVRAAQSSQLARHKQNFRGFASSNASPRPSHPEHC